MLSRIKIKVIDDTRFGPDRGEDEVPSVWVIATITGDGDGSARARTAELLRLSLTYHRLNGSEGTRQAFSLTPNLNTFTMGYEWAFIEDDSPDFERAWRESGAKIDELVGSLVIDLRGVAEVGIDL